MSGDHQRRVEHGLSAAVQVAGRPVEAFDLGERMRRYAVPGVSVAVVEDGEIDWAAGFGVQVAGGAAVAPATLFQAGSISKPVSALAVLALVEQGRFGLDDDVNDHLRSWRLPDSPSTAGRPVAPRLLLSHRAGTTVHGFPGYSLGAPLPSVTEVLAGVAPANTEPVVSFGVPGTVTRYSGGGTTILQLLVTDVTRRPFPEVVSELVLEPFGMADSRFEQPLAPVRLPFAAHGHDENGSELDGGMHVYPELAAAGLWTTAVDLARFVLGVQSLLRGAAGGPVSAGMARQIIEPVGPGPFGLGLELAGEGAERRFHHAGTNAGFCAHVDGFAGRPAGAAVMTNGQGGRSLLGEIRRSIAAEYAWPGFDALTVELAAVPEATLQRYAGRYLNPLGHLFAIDLVDGVLSTAAPYGRRPLLPLGETRFIDDETGTILEFEVDGDRVARVAVIADGGETMEFRPEPAATS